MAVRLTINKESKLFLELLTECNESHPVWMNTDNLLFIQPTTMMSEFI